MNIINKYKKLCNEHKIPFQLNLSVRSYDDSTLFCPAGMQQFKEKFEDEKYKGSIANIQSCIRLNDFKDIGDGVHLAYFNMIGLFSFRILDVETTIDFFLEFIDRLGIEIEYATVHPDKKEWKEYYKKHNIKVKYDKECKWSDGNIGGYCTEFYVDGLEVGNIVNPLGTCIDVGFGLDRLEQIVNKAKPKNRIELLKDCALKIIESGYRPSNTKQGYVLRKILREIYESKNVLDHKYFVEEIERQNKIKKRYETLLKTNKDKDKKWWYETHGIKI